ncbi:MAG TPA: hypothetical protein VKC57_08465 [Ktedonobacterales bacterium]|jgi:hypothetical protein|nr:hypothetical protein [Ktedonobacterales bacterium]
MTHSLDTGGPPTDELRCPFCGSTDTELLSLFGSQLLTEQRYCHACRTPFEHIKDDQGRAAARRPFRESDHADQ